MTNLDQQAAMPSTKTISYGDCHCGCGGKTVISTYSDKRKGWVAGVPRKFILSHKRYPRANLSHAVPFKIEGVYCRLIPLTQGQYAIVDAEDYEALSCHNWCAVWNEDTRSYYAMRHARKGEFRLARILRMHREVMGLADDDPRQGDHENNVTLDNRRGNLRKASKANNRANRRKLTASACKYKGVSIRPHHPPATRFVARISKNSKNVILGYFSTEEDAHARYYEEAKRIHGRFARKH